MTQTVGTCSLIIEREIPHAPELIWRALTESSLLAQWLLKNDFEPVVGHRCQFRSTPMPQWSGIIDSEVLEVKPHSRLVYSWMPSGGEGHGGPTWVVTFTLTPTAAGTHLRMEQSGFQSEEGPDYKGAKYGWSNFLNNLDRVVGGLQ